MLETTVTTINWFILWYFIALSGGYLLLLITSIPDIFFRYNEYEIGNIIGVSKSHILPPITTIIPAYNEESNVIETIYSVLKCRYANIEILVLNDGSTDKTLSMLINEFDLVKTTGAVREKIPTVAQIRGYYFSNKYKNLTVIDKVNSGKSDTVNLGLNACTTPLFMTVDADTLLVEPDAISYMAFALLTRPHTVSVGGALYILNGCDFKKGVVTNTKMSYNVVAAVQICEYLRSFLFGRSGWNVFKGALCYPGAFTLFDHQAVVDVGGFDVGNIAQDFEIIVHLQEAAYDKKYPYVISFCSSAIAWTEVPATLGEYWQQRMNWQEGSLRSLFMHINMLFNPKYGIVGFFTFPFYLFGEILGPMVEFTAYLMAILSWYLGIINLYWVVLLVCISWGFICFLTMATTLINFMTYNKYRRARDILWILLMVFVEQFGFRQYHVICSVTATVKYAFRKAADGIKYLFA